MFLLRQQDSRLVLSPLPLPPGATIVKRKVGSKLRETETITICNEDERLSDKDVSSRDASVQNVSSRDVFDKDLLNRDVLHRDNNLVAEQHMLISIRPKQKITHKTVCDNDESRVSVKRDSVKDVSVKDVAHKDALSTFISCKDVQEKNVQLMYSNITGNNISSQNILRNNIRPKGISMRAIPPMINITSQNNGICRSRNQAKDKSIQAITSSSIPGSSITRLNFFSGAIPKSSIPTIDLADSSSSDDGGSDYEEDDICLKGRAFTNLAIMRPFSNNTDII